MLEKLAITGLSIAILGVLGKCFLEALAATGKIILSFFLICLVIAA